MSGDREKLHSAVLVAPDMVMEELNRQLITGRAKVTGRWP